MKRLSPAQWVVILIAGSTLVRLWFAGMTGLGFDESYMLGNARQFELSYVDQVPMHLWMAGLARVIFGSEAPIFVRLPFVLMFAGSIWLMYRLTERLFGERAGLWAVIAFNLAPVFSVSHSSWILADGPLIFFLLATGNVVARILFDEPSPARPLLWWLGAGVLAGLAILSKYHAGFFILSVFITLLTLPGARKRLATPGPWLAAGVAIIVFTPVILWNAEHGFIGFAFQSKRVETPVLGWRFLAENVGGQLLYLTPWLAVPFAISLIGALRRGPRDGKSWYMALAAIGPIAMFTSITLFSRGFPHWSMPGWLFTIPLFGRDAALLAESRPVFAKGYMTAIAVVFVALLSALAFQVTQGGLVPHAVTDKYAALDPTVDLVNWTDLRIAMDERGLLPPGAVVASPIWMTAGKVSYALGPGVPVVCVCQDPQHFAYRYDQTQWQGRDVVVVVPRGQDWMWEVAGAYFDGFEPLNPVAITRNGQTVITLDLRLGKNLHFPPK